MTTPIVPVIGATSRGQRQVSIKIILQRMIPDETQELSEAVRAWSPLATAAR